MWFVCLLKSLLSVFEFSLVQCEDSDQSDWMPYTSHDYFKRISFSNSLMEAVEFDISPADKGKSVFLVYKRLSHLLACSA